MPVKTKLAKGISLTCITVSDLSKAKHLFVDLLGLELKEYQKERQWMEVGGSDGSLMGIGENAFKWKHCGLKANNNIVISVEVYNLESAINLLKKHKVKFHGEIIEIPDEVKMILFEDFEGNRFFLTQTFQQEI